MDGGNKSKKFETNSISVSALSLTMTIIIILIMVFIIQICPSIALPNIAIHHQT